MIDFVSYILPGVFFTFVVETLLHKRFSRHDFLFLAVANIIALDSFSLGVRQFVVNFLFKSTSQPDNDSLAGAFVKYMIVTGVVGIVMSLLEAFLCKHVSLRLEDTKAKDGQKK